MQHSSDLLLEVAETSLIALGRLGVWVKADTSLVAYNGNRVSWVDISISIPCLVLLTHTRLQLSCAAWLVPLCSTISNRGRLAQTSFPKLK